MINRLRTDIFFRRYAIFFTGSMIVAFLNYIFYPVLGRLVSPSDFGDIQAFVLLATQSTVIFGAFSAIAVNTIANVEDSSERNAVISGLQKIVFLVIGVVLVFLLLFISQLKSFFNFSSIYPLIGLAVTLFITATTMFRSSYLQGSGQFTQLSISSIISSLGRLVFVTSFILLGLGMFGSIFGIVLANALVLAYVFYKTKDSLHLTVISSTHTLKEGSIMKEVKYGVLVFFATSLVVIFYTADVLIVKHYFSSIDAGLYSGVSAIAKILFFALGPSTAILFPSVKLKQSFADNSTTLKKSLLVSFIVGGCGLIIFYLWGGIIISLMIGDKYASFAHFLPKAGIVMLLSAVVNIFIFYFLALRRFFLIGISLVGMILFGFVLSRAYTSIDTILNSLIVSLVIITALLLIVYAKDYFNYRSSLQ